MNVLTLLTCPDSNTFFKVEWNTSVISSMTEETGAWSGLVGFFDATKYGAREGNSSIVKSFFADHRK